LTFQTYRDVLPSGLTVVTIETPHLHSAVCAVYVRVGSRHESPRNNGVSHLLEHLFFRGSHRYRDSVAMNAAIEAVGGNLNGVTMRDLSSFYTPTHPDGVEVAVRILGDMLSRPRLVHLNTERKIILEEMLDEVDERGRDIDVDNLTKVVLYPDHPLALKIAGTPRTVNRISAAQLRRHLRRFYVSGNMVLAVAGPVRRAEVLGTARRAFRHLRRGPRAAERAPKPLLATAPRLKYVTLDETQVVFRLSFPTVSETHPDAPALGLLRRILDDGLSSRLPHAIVERRGLAYSIGATLETFDDTGAFEIDGACAAKRVGATVRETLRTVATLRAGDISREELRRVQRRFRLHLDFLQDSPGDLCTWFGASDLFHAPEPFALKCAQVDALTVEDLRRVARRYLSAQTLVTVGVGPGAGRRPFAQAVGAAERWLGETRGA
jgi:predicted Zn-dependent peptidase